MSQKRARQKRRQAAEQRGLMPPNHRLALGKAAADRDKELGRLHRTYSQKLTGLSEEWAGKRREVWRAYDERRVELRKAEAEQQAELERQAA
jgi:hypothetical protein